MCGYKFLRQWLWHSLAKLCTKNYENPSIFVKVTAKKSVALFFWTRCRMIGLPYGEKNCDNKLSRFHLMPERHGQTGGQTELLYQYRASVCWRAIKSKAQQDIRSFELGVCPMQLFFIFDHFCSSSSNCASVYKISSKADDFSLRYGDITIFKMAAVRHLGIVLIIDLSAIS